jgi:outer membrane protein TolC
LKSRCGRVSAMVRMASAKAELAIANQPRVYRPGSAYLVRVRVGVGVRVRVRRARARARVRARVRATRVRARGRVRVTLPKERPHVPEGLVHQA